MGRVSIDPRDPSVRNTRVTTKFGSPISTRSISLNIEEMGTNRKLSHLIIYQSLFRTFLIGKDRCSTHFRHKKWNSILQVKD